MAEPKNQRRIQKEIKDALNCKLFKAIWVDTDNKLNLEKNCLYLKFTVETKDSFYEGQTHVMLIHFTESGDRMFPAHSPKVNVLTPFLHANINGPSICLDILKDKWSPMYNVETIYNSFIALLECPNPQSALNHEGRKANKQKCTDFYLTTINSNKTYYDNLFSMFT